MPKIFLRSLIVIVFLSLVLCGVYPATVWVMGRVFFTHKATGSFIKHGNTWIGSELIGQTFTRPEYFQGRPSASAYNAMASGGSNLAPSHPQLPERFLERSQLLLEENPAKTPVPVELLTASGSGLDPHLPPAAVRWQIPRIAKIRGLAETRLEALVAQLTEPPTLGFLGKSRVNILRLNVELDKLAPLSGTEPQ